MIGDEDDTKMICSTLAAHAVHCLLFSCKSVLVVVICLQAGW